MATKETLISEFADGQLVTGERFKELINSMKGVQTPVISPTSSGNAKAFIDSISQDAEGKITVTKKTVDSSVYQTVAGMGHYQNYDKQKVGDITIEAGVEQTITHNMHHYPTVRLMETDGMEVEVSEYKVQHVSGNEVKIIAGSRLSGTYKYILD